jgi:hypothetical protein
VGVLWALAPWPERMTPPGRLRVYRTWNWAAQMVLIITMIATRGLGAGVSLHDPQRQVQGCRAKDPQVRIDRDSVQPQLRWDIP